MFGIPIVVEQPMYRLVFLVFLIGNGLIDDQYPNLLDGVRYQIPKLNIGVTTKNNRARKKPEG